MCGVAGQFRSNPDLADLSLLSAMLDSIKHRGPDDQGLLGLPHAELAHARLSIIDLSAAGRQPFADPSGRWFIIFNGEIYNYLELRRELAGVWDFRTRTDTEVLLAAYLQWGESCLDRLIGMFVFLIWDAQNHQLFAARDRFGVKPLFYANLPDGTLALASEIKALHQAGLPKRPRLAAWASYFATGMHDENNLAFWDGVHKVPAGGWLRWQPGSSSPQIGSWYDLASRTIALGHDQRSDAEVGEELLSLLEDSVRLRFRADVPVGVCLSGGLDSSLLWGLTKRIQGGQAQKVLSFTFACGDPNYDETPWVQAMLGGDQANGRICLLRPEEIPKLAADVQSHQDEPYGGFPTLGMSKVHQAAQREGVIVLLDGNGLDEGWAGYEYYARADSINLASGPVQGSKSPTCRPDCLKPEFLGLAQRLEPDRPWGDPLRDLQYRDIRYAKIPRAMRFADRVSMMWSRELREPFLDHRIIELGLRQPIERKIRDGQGKWLARQIAAQILPDGVRLAPKRPVQTPQREWLREELRDWTTQQIENALDSPLGQEALDPAKVRQAWAEFQTSNADNSFPIWQWISLGLMENPRE